MYVGNRYFTFRLGHEGFWRAYLSYMLVGGIVVALAAGLLAMLVEWLGVDPRLGQAISLLLVMPARRFSCSSDGRSGCCERKKNLSRRHR